MILNGSSVDFTLLSRMQLLPCPNLCYFEYYSLIVVFFNILETWLFDRESPIAPVIYTLFPLFFSLHSSNSLLNSLFLRQYFSAWLLIYSLYYSKPLFKIFYAFSTPFPKSPSVCFSRLPAPLKTAILSSSPPSISPEIETSTNYFPINYFSAIDLDSAIFSSNSLTLSQRDTICSRWYLSEKLCSSVLLFFSFNYFNCLFIWIFLFWVCVRILENHWVRVEMWEGMIG